MPDFDPSDLNIVLSVLGFFVAAYGFVSIKIKQKWYLGEALPALIIGVGLGLLAKRFLDQTRWNPSAQVGPQNYITLGIMRVVIGVQLIFAGYQLPAKYQLGRWREMLICLVPVMTTMWLCTTACIMVSIPNLSLLAALVIGSCITCTDPVISQAIAKGPFADQYVPRPLREIISSEAGANDGFCFPFLMLAVYLMRHSEIPDAVVEGDDNDDVGRQGGGIGVALKNWGLETWLYVVILSVIYGALVGYGGGKLMRCALKRKWVDSESYHLFPSILGLFLVGTCGAIGTDDQLACFAAGNGINWDGEYLKETEKHHSDVNSCIDVLLNYTCFMYIGAIMPWSEFHQPDLTGITITRLIGLGCLILIFRRIPAIFITYKFMPEICRDAKDALFMGYFGPIGAGAVFYVEHTRINLLPALGEGDEGETTLLRAIGPVVYWLVFFSIIVHGLSIPVLNLAYRLYDLTPIREDPVEVKCDFPYTEAPPNAVPLDKHTYLAYNRFSRPVVQAGELPTRRVTSPPSIIHGELLDIKDALYIKESSNASSCTLRTSTMGRF